LHRNKNKKEKSVDANIAENKVTQANSKLIKCGSDGDLLKNDMVTGKYRSVRSKVNTGLEKPFPH